MSEIKKGHPQRGVSVYSYADLYGISMTLEDIFMDISDMGATCFEILSSHIKNYPQPTTEWIDNFFYLCEKYKLQPGEYGHWCDTRLFKGRYLNDDEALANLERDFKLAHLLGFKALRTKITTTNNICDPAPGWESYLEKALPLAEKYDVYMGSEIHRPTTIHTPHIETYIEFIEKHKTKHFGFCLDFGTFQNQFPEVAERKGGMTDDMNDEQRKQWEEEQKMHSKPEEILHILPYITGCHAKFNYIDENFEELTIPYKEVLNTLVDNGYNGVMVSEYEGPNRDSYEFMTEQLRRHHILMKNILGY